jgi:hypothetical protein
MKTFWIFLIACLIALGAYPQAIDYDGVDAYLNQTIDYTGVTVGTISCWIMLQQDQGAMYPFFVDVSSAANTVTYIFYGPQYKNRGAAGIDTIAGRLRVDNSDKWQFKGPDNWTDTRLNTILHLVLVQNGTAPVLYCNAATVSISWVSQADKTKWLDALDTASTPANANWICRHRSATKYLNALIYELVVWDVPFSASQVNDLYLLQSRTAYQGDNCLVRILGKHNISPPEGIGPAPAKIYDQGNKGIDWDGYGNPPTAESHIGLRRLKMF